MTMTTDGMRNITWTKVQVIVHEGGIVEVERTTFTANVDECHTVTESALFALVPLVEEEEPAFAYGGPGGPQIFA